MRILITGANGQLGRQLTKVYKDTDSELLLTDVGVSGMDALDITDIKRVYEYVNEKKPDLIINCAAHTKVDKCEAEYDKAFRINAIGPKNLAEASNSIGAEIVQISTDYVFSGEVNKELTEFDVPEPKTVYGVTKLYGENMVKELNPKHYIIRTAWLYGDGNNFVKTMLKLSKEHDTIKVVNDQIGTPTSTVDLANVIVKIVSEKNYGLFHCTCKGKCSWYDFACEIFKLKSISVNVVPCTSDEYVTPAKRPKFSVLRNYMLEMTTGDITRNWKDSLEEYLKNL